jgi:hypothetical protein
MDFYQKRQKERKLTKKWDQSLTKAAFTQAIKGALCRS